MEKEDQLQTDIIKISDEIMEREKKRQEEEKAEFNFYHMRASISLDIFELVYNQAPDNNDPKLDQIFMMIDPIIINLIDQKEIEEKEMVIDEAEKNAVEKMEKERAEKQLVYGGDILDEWCKEMKE